MINNRIKTLARRIIKAVREDEGGVYCIKILDGIYSCDNPEMLWPNEQEFRKWENTLEGDNVIIIYPEQHREMTQSDN